jgi:predicted acylesterase/phospholipase RssA/tetratricopeptide (TPR) repeat protein
MTPTPVCGKHGNRDELFAKARDVLRGQDGDSKELFDLAKRLKAEKAFHYAWQLIARARRVLPADAPPDRRLLLAQQHALCLYKNPDLPAEERFDRALEILERDCDLANTDNQETLGIAGAVHKYRWYWDGQRKHLERSLHYYRRGYQAGEALGPKEYDDGYTAINTAFVLDMLANLEAADAAFSRGSSPVAKERWDEARKIRQELVKILPKRPDMPENHEKNLNKQWWFLVTVAEAFLGLGESSYDDATAWLQKAAALPCVSDWEKESTVRQFASLAGLQEDQAALMKQAAPPAWQVLKNGLNISEVSARAAIAGKVGLALSGGGFRASFFHIGVLARLAEMDLLRHVEVLSCVSGGSIVGARYYLEVRKLLADKADAAIQADDYISIVRNIAEDFLDGVQKNIRTRVFTELWTNIRTIFLPNYSHTERIAELFEEVLYAKTVPIPSTDGTNPDKHLWLDQLRIRPDHEVEGFDPRRHNWRRDAKAPILILNATTLNTGHNWQFTASFMGESPGLVDREIDGGARYRRMYYSDAPGPYKQFRLGRAVAASACVPGLFTPLALTGLYGRRSFLESLLLPQWWGRVLRQWLSDAKEPVTVRLADGGVHDNQGAAGLLEQECSLLLISDASGQSPTLEDPDKGRLGVALRSNDILMSRVRGAQYSDEKSRYRSGLLRGLMYVHLRQGLEDPPVDWVDCADPYVASEEARRNESLGTLTPYGIGKKAQGALAAIRTDLDSFSDAEAWALMTSGYRTTEHALKPYRAANARSRGGLAALPESSLPAQRRPVWPFLDLESELKQVPPPESLFRILRTARHRGFKVWRLSRPLQFAGLAVGGIALALLIWACVAWWSTPLVTVPVTARLVVLPLLVLTATFVFGPFVVRAVRVRETLAQIAFGVSASVFGKMLGCVHLRVFDRHYLELGRRRKRLTHEDTMAFLQNQDVWYACRPGPSIWAAQVKGDGVVSFTLKSTREMVYPAGAYVVARCQQEPWRCDASRLEVVDESLFETTYELLP